MSTVEEERVRRRRRVAAWSLGWVLAAGLAITVGIVAVSSVGASIRGRGPLGNEVIRNAGIAQTPTPDPDAAVVRRTFDGDFGTFVVECRGTAAVGVDAQAAPGWRTVSFEPGPADDVDAVFARRLDSVEIEVFCNRGVPTQSELERNRLPDDD